jgi:hypothetical protein
MEGAPRTGVGPATDRRLFYCVQGALADTSLMPSHLTIAVLMLDIKTEWTLNGLLTTSSSYRKCSKRRTLDHSAQAISLLQIEGTTRR